MLATLSMLLLHLLDTLNDEDLQEQIKLVSAMLVSSMPNLLPTSTTLKDILATETQIKSIHSHIQPWEINV